MGTRRERREGERGEGRGKGGEKGGEGKGRWKGKGGGMKGKGEGKGKGKRKGRGGEGGKGWPAPSPFANFWIRPWLGVWVSAVSSPSGVWGRSPSRNKINLVHFSLKYDIWWQQF